MLWQFVVTHHQLVGDFGRHQAKCQDVETGVLLKQLDGGLLVYHDGQSDHSSNVEER